MIRITKEYDANLYSLQIKVSSTIMTVDTWDILGVTMDKTVFVLHNIKQKWGKGGRVKDLEKKEKNFTK